MSVIAVTTAYNVILFINSTQKSLHAPLLIIGILLIPYYFSHILLFTDNMLDDRIDNLKNIYTFILLAAIPFNYFIKKFTGYPEKIVFASLQALFILIAIMNIYSPTGIVYDSITGIEPNASILKDSFTITGVSNRYYDSLMILTAFQIVFIALAFRHQFIHGKRRDTVFLALVLSLMIAVNFFDTYFLNIHEEISYAFLYLLISIRVSNQVLESYKLRDLLQRSEEKYKKVFDNSAFGIFQLNSEGFIILLNPAGRKILAIEENYASNSVNFYNFFTEKGRINQFREMTVSFSDSQGFETVIRDLKGEEKYIRLFAKENLRDKIAVIDGIFEDFGEKKKAEDLLLKAKSDAEKASRLKSEFLAMISHEIRTPLNIIGGSSEIIESELNEEQRNDLDQFLYNIKDASKRIIRTIESIVLVSQLKTGTYESIRRSVNFQRDLLPGIIETGRKLSASSGVGFTYDGGGEPILLSTDIFALSQSMTHLLENAFKFTKRGVVNLKAILTDDALNIIITDTGIGMSEEFQSNISDPFRQEEQGYDRSFEGNGLGLTLVNEYCRINDMALKIESVKGSGTSVTLTVNCTSE